MRRARFIVMLGLVLGAVSSCEILLSAHIEKNTPPLGVFTLVDGRKLQIDCRGSGPHTLIIESGHGDLFGGLSWSIIQAELATESRVCTYTRAGYVWSESRRRPLHGEDIAQDLHTALIQTGEQAPYIMLGYSFGGLNTLIFADLFKDEVEGLIFVESSHPTMLERNLEAGMPDERKSPSWITKIGRTLRWTGLPRLFSSSYCENVNIRIESERVCKAYYPDSLDGYISELEGFYRVSDRAALVTDLGNLPVLVLTRQLSNEWLDSDPEKRAVTLEREALWQEMHHEISLLSTKGEHRVVPNSRHSLPFTHTELIVEEVEALIDRIDE